VKAVKKDRKATNLEVGSLTLRMRTKWLRDMWDGVNSEPETQRKTFKRKDKTKKEGKKGKSWMIRVNDTSFESKLIILF
jgi:hypothetical protein